MKNRAHGAVPATEQNVANAPFFCATNDRGCNRSNVYIKSGALSDHSRELAPDLRRVAFAMGVLEGKLSDVQ